MLDSWIMKLDLAKLIIIGALVTVASNLYAWEKVPVPDYVNKKTKSPWNFYDDFEDQKVGKVNLKRYPMVKLFKYLPEKQSLFETIIVSTNDVLVELFLKKQIKFNQISTIFFKVINQKEFMKYKKIRPKNVKEIVHLNNYVRLKILEKVYKSDYD